MLLVCVYSVYSILKKNLIIDNISDECYRNCLYFVITLGLSWATSTLLRSIPEVYKVLWGGYWRKSKFALILMLLPQSALFVRL